MGDRNRARRNDACRANRDGNVKYLLLLAPCLLAIAVPLFNFESPEFIGIPFFYWFQMLLVPLSALCIYAADRLGKA
jgi:hypothetical protein